MIARTLAIVALLLASGCAQLPLTKEPTPTADEGEWAAARARATRSGKLYDGLATNAFIRTVYLPRDVRDARVARIAEWKALSPEETDRMLVAERDAAARYEEFLVFLFTPDLASNDLDSRTSVWRLALVVPGSPDVLPDQVEQIRPDALMRALHPDLGDFDTVYKVRFPRQQELSGKSFIFRLAGAKGRIDMQY